MTDPNYPPVPPTQPSSPWPPAPPPPTTTPPPPPPMPSENPNRGPRLFAIGVGVVALVGGAAFAVTSLGSDGGGAASPEEAAERLIDAINDEDILGIIDLLPDGERELLGDLARDAADEYQRLNVLSDAFQLDGLQGINIVIEDAEFDIDEITDGDGDDDGLAIAVLDGGDGEIELDGDSFLENLGDVVEDLADELDADLDVDDAEEEFDAEELNLPIAIVEEGGRWHPSVFFTLAEAARTSEDLDEPDLDDGVDPEGADSPEEAVQALIDAGIELDAEAAIALLDPGEARALQVYAQYFLPVEADVDDDFELTAELTDADVDDLGGGVNRVIPTGFEVHFSQDGGTADFVFEDGCFSVDIQPPPDEDDAEPIDEEVCAGDELVPDEIGEVEVPDALQELVEAFQPIRAGIVTVERDGEHFISPLRTAGDLALAVTRGLEPEDLEEGGIVFELLAGNLNEDLEDFVDELSDDALFGDFEDEFDDAFDDDFDDDVDPDDDCEGVGCGFDDDEPDDEVRVPTGASGPNGELVPFDAVAGAVAQDETATFIVVADITGDFVIGAQGIGGFDGTIRILDPATGEELDFSDDFNGFDPEVLVTLQAGQSVVVEVRGFAGQPGEFVVYFEDF